MGWLDVSETRGGTIEQQFVMLLSTYYTTTGHCGAAADQGPLSHILVLDKERDKAAAYKRLNMRA